MSKDKIKNNLGKGNQEKGSASSWSEYRPDPFFRKEKLKHKIKETHIIDAMNITDKKRVKTTGGNDPWIW